MTRRSQFSARSHAQLAAGKRSRRTRPETISQATNAAATTQPMGPTTVPMLES
jgi:hypothetical protein